MTHLTFTEFQIASHLQQFHWKIKYLAIVISGIQF